MIKRESLWHSTVFVCLFAFCCFLPLPGQAHPRPHLSPPPALPRSQERKVWEVPNKGSGERSAPCQRRAAAAPARPAALWFPAMESRLPSCVPQRKKAPSGKERNKLSGYANKAPARSAPGRAAAPAPAPRPASPRLGPAGGNKWSKAAESEPLLPHRTPRPRKGRELGNERLPPHSRPPEGGTGSYSVKAMVLSLSLYIHTYKNIHPLYILLHYLSHWVGYDDTFYCMNYLKNICVTKINPRLKRNFSVHMSKIYLSQTVHNGVKT